MNLLGRTIALTILLLLAACTVGENEPAAEGQPTATTPALREITPQMATMISEPTVEPPTDEPVEPTKTEVVQDQDASSSAAAESGSVSPAEVDLSQITSQPDSNVTPQVMPQPGVPDPAAAAAHQAGQDLADRLGVDVGAIQTISVVEVEWPDSSLGCPTPGMVYLTVMTPGYLVTLDAAGEPYTYHTDLQNNHVLCDKDGNPLNS
jgi:hypothetical protein